MKLAIISLKGKTSELIRDECEKLFDKVDFINIKDIEVKVGDSFEVLWNGQKLDDYDTIYCRGSHKYALLQASIAEALGNRCYMPFKSKSFIIGHNKFLTLLEFQKAHINYPTTYLAATTKSARKVLEKIHYPIIVKIPSGTHGKGVMTADSFASASSVLDALEVFGQPYIIQDYVETNATDVRALVLGDKVVGAMKRKAMNGELRANIHQGGIGMKIILDAETEKIAIKAAKAVGAEICAVDILQGIKPQVIEVNLSPSIIGLSAATKVNYASKIADFLYKKAESLKNTKKNNEIVNALSVLKKKGNEIYTNLTVKLDKIRLPSIITRLTKFVDEDEVIIKASEGKIEITKAK